MERMNKVTFFRNLLFEERERKKFLKTACGLVLAFHSWNIPLCADKKRIIYSSYKKIKVEDLAFNS